jgi:RNA polymerase sigma factor (sigma-70 family)
MNESQSFRCLLLEATNGSELAASKLLQQYGPLVVVAVRRALARELRSQFDSSDFAQAVWASFFANRTKLEDFASPEELMRFLGTMARNKVLDEFRRRCQLQKYNVHRERPLDDAVTATVHDGGPRPSQIAAVDELWQRLTVGRTPQEQAILQLRRTGYTNHEIASRIGISERTVRRLINRVFEEVVS